MCVNVRALSLSLSVCTYTHKDAHAHTRIHATGVRRQARNRNACYRALFTRCDRVLAQVSATPRHPPPAAGNGGVSQFLRKIGVSVPQLRPRRGVSCCSPVDRRFSDGTCQEAASRVLAQLTSSDKGCLKTGAAQRRMTDALNRGTLQHNSRPLRRRELEGGQAGQGAEDCRRQTAGACAVFGAPREGLMHCLGATS